MVVELLCGVTVELLLVLLLVELVLVVPMLILVFGVTVVTNSVVSLCFFLHPSPLTTPYHYSIHPRCHVQRSSNHAVSVGRFVEPRRFKFRTRDTVGVDGGAAYGGGDGGREKVRAACRCVGTDVVYTINRTLIMFSVLSVLSLQCHGGEYGRH